MPALDLANSLYIPQLPAQLELVNQRLVRVASSAPAPLKQPLLRTVNAKSKRLRPALLIASVLGAQVDQKMIAAGSAIELIHLGSLVHDDIIDKADTRWGRPTISQSDGQATALLVGDFLLARAGGSAAEVSADAAQLISDTIVNLIQGESREITDKYKLDRTIDSYLACIQAKTAALISAACRLGGLCAGLSPAQIESLASYGKNLGIAFQLIDDLLDIVSTSALMGKPVGNDAKEGVYTWPILISMQSGSQAELQALLGQPNPPKAKLADLLIANHSVSKTILEAKKYNQLAQSALSDFDAKAIRGLLALPDNYLSWSLNNLVPAAYRTKIL
jgi:geranylgeranyl pyrophosphate synthase